VHAQPRAVGEALVRTVFRARSLLFVVAWAGLLPSCVSRPKDHQVWSVEYSRHGGFGGWDVDMVIGDDGRSWVRIGGRAPQEGIAPAAQVTEISNMLETMVHSGELSPKRWKWPLDFSCWGVIDCQTLDLIAVYKGKTYAIDRTDGPLFGELLYALQDTAFQVGNVGPRATPCGGLCEDRFVREDMTTDD